MKKTLPFTLLLLVLILVLATPLLGADGTRAEEGPTVTPTHPIFNPTMTLVWGCQFGDESPLPTQLPTCSPDQRALPTGTLYAEFPSATPTFTATLMPTSTVTATSTPTELVMPPVPTATLRPVVETTKTEFVFLPSVFCFECSNLFYCTLVGGE